MLTKCLSFARWDMWQITWCTLTHRIGRSKGQLAKSTSLSSSCRNTVFRAGYRPMPANQDIRDIDDETHWNMSLDDAKPLAAYKLFCLWTSRCRGYDFLLIRFFLIIVETHVQRYPARPMNLIAERISSFYIMSLAKESSTTKHQTLSRCSSHF